MYECREAGILVRNRQRKTYQNSKATGSLKVVQLLTFVFRSSPKRQKSVQMRIGQALAASFIGHPGDEVILHEFACRHVPAHERANG